MSFSVTYGCCVTAWLVAKGALLASKITQPDQAISVQKQVWWWQEDWGDLHRYEDIYPRHEVSLFPNSRRAHLCRHRSYGGDKALMSLAVVMSKVVMSVNVAIVPFSPIQDAYFQRLKSSSAALDDARATGPKLTMGYYWKHSHYDFHAKLRIQLPTPKLTWKNVI